MITAVIGHLVLDEIHTLERTVHESLGGIAFPLGAFTAIAGNGDTVYPVFPIGEDAVISFKKEFPPSDIVLHRYVFSLPEPNTRVRLYHETLAHYNTRLVSSLDPVPFQKIESATRDADLVYINMMTGDDILPETLEQLRAHTRATIFLDVHMIAYATAHDGARRLTNVPNWRKWADHADIIQCNEHERANFISGYTSEQNAVNAVFESCATRVIIITKGEQGADVYLREGKSFHVDAIPQPKTVDPTGCGDVFGSVFAYFYTAMNDAHYAARMAVHAASFVAGIPGSNGISALRTYLDTIR